MVAPVRIPHELHSGFANPKVKPSGPLAIDWSHPLAQALEGCWTFNALPWPELVHGESPRLGASSAKTIDLVVKNRSLRAYMPAGGTAAANMTWLEQPDRDHWSFVGTQPHSFFFKGSGENTDRVAICSKWEQASPMLGDAYHFSIGATRKLFYCAIESNTSDRLAATGDSTIPNDGTEITLAAVNNGGVVDETIDLYYNGEAETLTYEGTDLSYGGMKNHTGSLAIGAGLQVDVNWWTEYEGTFDVLYMWRRPLTAAEVKSLHLDPYQFLIPAQDLSYQTASVAAGRTVNMTLATLSATKNNDTVYTDRGVTAGLSTMSATPYSGVVGFPRAIEATLATLSTTANAVTTYFDRGVSAALATLSATKYNVTVSLTIKRVINIALATLTVQLNGFGNMGGWMDGLMSEEDWWSWRRRLWRNRQQPNPRK